MKKYTLYFVVILLFMTSFVLSACGGGGGEAGVARPTPPPEYAGKTNPVANDPNAVAAGQTLYAANCASCHGESGQGDGPAGAALDPKPTNLTETAAQASDDYIYWRIAEGGAMEPFNSSMPPWKGILSDEEIWQVVSNIKSMGG